MEVILQMTTSNINAQLKVIVSDSNPESEEMLTSALSCSGMNAISRKTIDATIDEIIDKEHPDVVITDYDTMTMPMFESIMSYEHRVDCPLFIVTTLYRNNLTEIQFKNLDYVILLKKPIPSNLIREVIKRHFNDTIQKITQKPDISADVNETVTDIIRKIGIPANLRGFHYLREAIILSVFNDAILESVTKELYPTVASHFDTTSTRVERAIRHALTIAWERGNMEELNKFFGYMHLSTTKATNSEFIATVADFIRTKYNR